MKQGSRQLRLPLDGAAVVGVTGLMGLPKPAASPLTLLHPPQLHASPPGCSDFNGVAKASSFPIDTRAGRRAGMLVNKVGKF